jgi:hypothetical protein
VRHIGTPKKANWKWRKSLWWTITWGKASRVNMENEENSFSEEDLPS